MDSYDGIPRLGRPAFFNGQRLTAADLAAVHDYDRQLRWLHNRSLHQWGVVDGFETRVSDDRRSVTVQPGYALDCHGRDLVMSQAVTLPIPAVAGSRRYYLTIAYAEDEQLAAETRTGIGAGVGAVRRIEDVKVRWQDPSDTVQETGYLRGEDLVLATIDVQNCRLIGDISPVNRQSATPSQQPYIAFGQTTPGETIWELFPNSENPVGVMTKVVTTNAGFRKTPTYFAYVVGVRLFELSSSPENDVIVIDGQVHLAELKASQFELRIVLSLGVTGQSGNYVISRSDHNHVASFALAQMGITVNLDDRSTNETKLCVGDRFPVMWWEEVDGHEQRRIGQIVGPLQPDDFIDAITTIAQSNSVSYEALLAVNELDPQNICLEIGQQLIVPGRTQLNPPKVLTEDFIQEGHLKNQWHVVWMGVEG